MTTTRTLHPWRSMVLTVTTALSALATSRWEAREWHGAEAYLGVRLGWCLALGCLVLIGSRTRAGGVAVGSLGTLAALGALAPAGVGLYLTFVIGPLLATGGGVLALVGIAWAVVGGSVRRRRENATAQQPQQHL